MSAEDRLNKITQCLINQIKLVVKDCSVQLVWDLMSAIYEVRKQAFEDWELDDEDHILDLVDKINIDKVHARIIQPACDHCDNRRSDEPSENEGYI